MTKGIIFYIVDVFAEAKYCGNQLAVIRSGNRLTTAEMQQLAKEMNYSETTFILSEEERDGGYDVRIFTPVTEVPFAGHPTLGTAWVIRQEILQQPVDRICLNLPVGQIPVSFDTEATNEEIIWMKQNPPFFGLSFEREKMAEALGLPSEAIDFRYPIQEVSTGLPFIIVPLCHLADIKKARVNQQLLAALTESSTTKDVLVFCPEVYDEGNNLNVRVFVDCLGIPEDPATGSANGCLAGYLAKYRYFGTDQFQIRVEQGMEIGRPSVLHLKADASRRDIEVEVGGQVFMVARGELV
ncbi:MAG TPA: PhzF family phenazine biosynthesis protein [Bacillota bacterium]|nr:PhzF family phenazine biosynthesis protein [Bacillota bacterium]